MDRHKQFFTSLFAAAFTYEINTQKYVCVSSMYLLIMNHNYKNVAAARNGMCKNIQRNSSSHDH